MGVDGPPVMPEDPYAYVVAAFHAPSSPDYVPGLEEPEQAPPLPVYVPYVPEPVYLEFMPSEDELFPAEEQPLPVAASPTVDSPGYVPDSDLEEDPEEDDDEDPEEEPANGGNDDAIDQAPSAEETKPFETDESTATPPPHTAYRIPSPPLPPILSPLPVSSPPPASPTYPLGYRAAMIRLRAEAPSISHSPPPHIILSHTRADTPPSGTPPLGTPPLLPIPLSTSSPSLLLPSADHRADRPEVCLPPQKRLCFTFSPRYEVGESSSAAAARPTGAFRADYGFIATMDREIKCDLERDVGYGITKTWDEMLVDMLGAPATDDTELGRRMTEYATKVRQDTDEIYVRLD
ncbi:hypothetical protein Tco_1469589 [Tanacetum coccineum]